MHFPRTYCCTFHDASKPSQTLSALHIFAFVICGIKLRKSGAQTFKRGCSRSITRAFYEPQISWFIWNREFVQKCENCQTIWILFAGSRSEAGTARIDSIVIFKRHAELGSALVVILGAWAAPLVSCKIYGTVVHCLPRLGRNWAVELCLWESPLWAHYLFQKQKKIIYFPN